MNYNDFSQWSEDVNFFWPDATIDTTNYEYTYSLNGTVVAYWYRDSRVGYISVD
jgi:hypothetical protein